MSTAPSRKLYTLDAMRGIAAFMVAAFHASYLHSNTQSPYLAVDFFFALSGFVVAYAYDARLRTGMSARQFIWRRLLRLYPLFALGLLLGLASASILTAMGSQQGSFGTLLLQFICGLLFLPFPSQDGNALIAPLNGPYWSLILEIHINVLFALLFGWLTLRVTAAIAVLFALALMVVGYTLGTLETGFRVSDYLGGVARVGFSFSAGILICRLRDRIPVPNVHWTVVLAAAAVLLVLPTPMSVRWLYDIVCVVALFPLLILCGARSQPSSRKLTQLFLLAGGSSYALYAIHVPIFNFGDSLEELYPGLPYKLVMLPLFLLACLGAIAADVWFDRPVRKWLGQKISQRRTPAAVLRTDNKLPVE